MCIRDSLSRASRKRSVAVGRGGQHVPILHWVRGGMRDGGSAGVGNGLVHASLGIFEPSGAISAAYFTCGMASVHRVVAWHWRYPRHRRYLLGGVLPGVALYGGRSAPH